MSCECIVFNHLSLSKDKSVFSLRAIIHEFFQKKLNHIKATKIFLYNPLTTSLVRLWRDYTVWKKHYAWSDLRNKNTPTPELFDSFILLWNTPYRRYRQII